MTKDLKPGDVFHTRYEIISKLGEGSMGSVYHAIQTDSGREVAIKLLLEDILASEKERARFLRECRILSKLSHEHIITFYSAALSEEGLLYGVCEFASGQTLYDLIQSEKQLSWPRTWKIVEKICQAMQFAHEQGIVHRDLKPENIMLLEKPEADWVKVLDFGFARALSPSQTIQRITATGMTLGTVCYMSPEQCQAGEIDGRSDIYSLACIIYECLSGKLLFQSEDPMSIIRMHLNDPPSVALQTLRSHVPDKLIEILQKALSKDPNKRYQTMEAFDQALQAVAEDPSSPASLPGKDSFASRIKALKFLFVASAVIVVALLVGLAYTIQKQQTARGLKTILHSASRDKSRSGIGIKQDLEHMYNNAFDLYTAKDYDGAEKLISEAMSLRKGNNYKCSLLLANILYYSGNKEAAQEKAKEALKLARLESGTNSPEYIRALALLGNALIGKNDEEAKRCLRDALRIWSGSQISANVELVDILESCMLLAFKQGKKQAVQEFETELLKWKVACESPETPSLVQEKFLLLQAKTKIELGRAAETEKLAEKGCRLLGSNAEELGKMHFEDVLLGWTEIYIRSGTCRKGVAQLQLAEQELAALGGDKSKHFLAQLYLAHANLLLICAEPAEAILVADTAYSFCEPGIQHNNNMAAAICLAKAQGYLAMSLPDLALVWIKKAESANADDAFKKKCNQMRQKAMSQKSK